LTRVVNRQGMCLSETKVVYMMPNFVHCSYCFLLLRVFEVMFYALDFLATLVRVYFFSVFLLALTCSGRMYSCYLCMTFGFLLYLTHFILLELCLMLWCANLTVLYVQLNWQQRTETSYYNTQN